jgi:3-phenylpropionate/trans-cinnamate dioxygenase ferredoxin component
MFNYTTKDPAQVDFIQIAPLADVPNGERLFVEIDEKKIVIFNIGGNIYAIGDVCSHDGGPLGDGEVEGMDVICPRHGARFDIKTGQALLLPAVEDIPAYPVRIKDGMIEIGVF